MDAGKITINEIFNGNKVLEIPFFQRSYVWGEIQWGRFLEDLEHVSNINKPYFLGSVIFKQIMTNSTQSIGDVRIVIDGQQRLTTLNIFFKVLCLKSQQSSYFDRIFRLISNNEISIRHNKNNIESFEKVLNLQTLEDLPQKDGDNIIQAYHYFKKNLEPSKFNLQNILSKILFVGIDLNFDETEQQIFDTINSLGVSLTTAELLKNYFFNRDEIENYKIYWENIFEKDDVTKLYWDREITTGSSKRTFIDLFFFSYLQIRVQDKSLNIKAEDKIGYSKVENLFESYKSFIKDYYSGDKNSILDEIKTYATIFIEHFDYEVVEKELVSDSGIDRINAIIFGLDTSTLIPYVLYILKNVVDENTKNELFGFIETYMMRRMVIHANTKNYNQFFTDRLINNEILSKEQFLLFLDNQEDKVNFLPSDDELEKGFNESKLINKQAAGILYLLESKIRDKKLHSTQLLGLHKYSLEHIMPKKWENHWDALIQQEDKITRNRKLLTLGNLTIITQSLNSSIRDANWSTKKVGKKDKKGLEIYATGIETMYEFLKEQEWSEETIQNRATFLYEKAKEIWKI